MIKKILQIIIILLFLSFQQICFAVNEIKITDLVFDNSSKIIFLPTYNTLDEVEKLNVESKSLENPNRTFFDISNSILTVGNIVYNFKNSPIEKVVLAQNSTNPNVVRLTFYHNNNIDLSKVELLKLRNGLVLKLEEMNIPNSSLHRSFREEKSLSSDFIEKLTFLKQISDDKNNDQIQNEVTSIINKPAHGIKTVGEDVLNNIFIPDDTKRLRSKSYIQKLSVRNGNILLNGLGNITVEKPIILSNPSRIAFDLANAIVSHEIKNKTFNISQNEKVLISQFEPTKVRVVIYTDNVNDYESVFSFDQQSLLIVNKNRISNVKLSDNISKLSSFTISNYNIDDKNLTFEFNNPCVFSYIRNPDNIEFIIYNANFLDITKIKTTLTNFFGEAKVESYGRSIIKITININPNSKTEFFETINGKKAVILIKNKMLKPQPIVIPKDNIEETINVPKNADKKLIVLDAGHGGSDVGATRNGIYEKDINLDVTNRLARMLTKKGFKIVLTRREDETVSLQERVEISNAKRPILFMSVHVNASVNESVRGVETHYWKDNSLAYAKIVQKHLCTIDSPARGVVKSKFYVINHTEAPAVLVEIGFISNTQERNELISEKRKEQTAKVLADAIVEYLKTVK
ncbi:MAG: hypothetical protein BHW64_00960 [Candidatus Melainabacteria bacterium LEY3_CP_29_8]|nr:MAG: hypothetical protein BHW64_00960 [Candidatus Melainabacteria bacterium LEY3_CP_29_8]